MKSSKLQAPNPKEAPSSTPQNEPDADWAWKDEDGIGDDVMILKDGDSNDRPQDFEERTALFGEAVIRLCKRVPRNPINDRLVGQLTGASTSVGANYCEANEGVSKKDFRYSVSRSKKEAKETRFFLRMLATSEPDFANDARKLYREATELLLIFSAMYRK